MICPHCGHDLSASESLLRHAKGPVQYALLRYLIAHPNEVITLDKLVYESYANPDLEPDNAKNGIRVLVLLLKRRLEREGWTITNQRGVGYILEKTHGPSE